MPQPRSSSSSTAKKKPAGKKPAAKRTSTAKATAARTTASRAKTTPRKTAPPKSPPAKGDDDKLTQLRELLSQAVVVPTERLQAVLDDARRRGHIDTKGVDAIRDGLLKQTDEVRGTLETLLERGRSSAEAVVSAATSVVRRGGGDKADDKPARTQAAPAKRSSAGSSTPDPTKLKANEVTSKLDGLTAAQLKKVRKQEADGPGRKSVLAAIDRKLK